jgi:predicted nucleic acid-binding protein
VIEEVTVDHAAVVEIALATRLTAYDASYLWLARELGAELVTLDGALERAAATLTGARRG